MVLPACIKTHILVSISKISIPRCTRKAARPRTISIYINEEISLTTTPRTKKKKKYKDGQTTPVYRVKHFSLAKRASPLVKTVLLQMTILRNIAFLSTNEYKLVLTDVH